MKKTFFGKQKELERTMKSEGNIPPIIWRHSYYWNSVVAGRPPRNHAFDEWFNAMEPIRAPNLDNPARWCRTCGAALVKTVALKKWYGWGTGPFFVALNTQNEVLLSQHRCIGKIGRLYKCVLFGCERADPKQYENFNEDLYNNVSELRRYYLNRNSF